MAAATSPSGIRRMPQFAAQTTDDLLVPGAIEDYGHKIGNSLIQRRGNELEILRQRRIQTDGRAGGHQRGPTASFSM